MQHCGNIENNLRQSDALLVSYPRSGNTWARLVLATTMVLEADRSKLRKLSVREITSGLIPDLYVKGLDRALQEELGLRSIFKTHDWIGGTSNPTVYLFRRPEDVLASYFNFAGMRGEISADLSIDEFAVGNLHGWTEHVAKAIDRFTEQPASIMPVAYELLRSHPFEEFTRILTWLDLPASESALRRSLRLNSFHRTRKRLFNVDKSRNFPMLQGKVGVGRSMLDRETLEQIRLLGDPVYEDLMQFAKRASGQNYQ